VNKGFQPMRERRPIVQVSTILTCALILWIGCCAGGIELQRFDNLWAARAAVVLIVAGAAAFCTLVITLMTLGVLKLVKHLRG